MKIVVSTDGLVKATHGDTQDIAGVPDYADCLVLTVPDSTEVEPGQAWEVPIDDYKAAVCARINAARDAVEYGIYTDSKGYRYDVDAKGRDKMTGLTAMLGATAIALPKDFTWTDADNEERPHDAESFLGLAVEIADWTSRVHNVAVAAKEAIRVDTVTTREEVLSIEAAISWPE